MAEVKTQDMADIEYYVKKNIIHWIKEAGYDSINPHLLERMVRVEEELRHQNETIIMLNKQMDKRFEQVDKRLEQVDKRFEEIIHYMDKRFEQVDKRFEEIIHYMDKRFEQVDKRFEQMDKRFEQVDKRFEQMDKRFEALTKRIDRFMIWSFGLVVAATGIIIATIKYL